MSYLLSYLMGAPDIQDQELEDLNIEIADRAESGSRMLKVPQESLQSYIDLVKAKLSDGFWNEIVGEKEIIYIFKFKNGTILEMKLTENSEAEIDKLCAKFNDMPLDGNVYKALSENEFYHDFMLEHYADMINR